MKTVETIVLEPKTAHFMDDLKAQGGPPLYQLSVEEARKVLDTLQISSAEKIEAQVEDRMIPGPKGDISIRIVRPKDSSGPLPVLMYFHGGGWILGNKETHDRLIRELATRANSAVVFVNYTPSPEAKYPIAIEEAYAATKYVSENGPDLTLDSKFLAVVGDSVGGNMATVVAMLAKERNGPKIDVQVLFYPVTDAAMNTDSYQEFSEGPWLTKHAMEWFWNAYAPESERKKPTVSPLQASIEDLKGLPPALIITAENDVLRDEGEAYARKLMEAGVIVAPIRYIGTIHDFMMLNALSSCPQARSALAMACAVLERSFYKAKDGSL